jgi:hypothetical protein
VTTTMLMVTVTIDMSMVTVPATTRPSGHLRPSTDLSPHEPWSQIVGESLTLSDRLALTPHPNSPP